MKISNLLLFCLVFSAQVSFGQLKAQVTAKEYENLANTLFKTFKYDSASFYYCKAAKQYEQKQQWLLCVKNYRLTSNALLKAAKYDTASFYSLKALNLAETYFHESNKDEMFEESNVLIGIADVDGKKGKLDQELSRCRGAMELTLKADSSAKLRIACVWNKMGWAYKNLAKYDSALYFCEKALDVRIQLLGENDISVGASLYCIGNIYELKREYNKALELYGKALSLNVSLLGEQHPDVADIYHCLGKVYVYKNEFDKALENNLKALNIRKYVYREQHPDLANSYHNIGAIYQKKGEFDKALEYFNKTLQIEISIYGETNSNIAITYNSIGVIYNRKGEYDRALEFYQKALNIRIPIYGEDHPDVANNYHSIGNTYNDKGEYDKALEFYQKALHIWILTYGENHPSVASCIDNIGIVYKRKGEYDKALEYHQKALHMSILAYGKNSPEVAMCYHSIGNLYYDKGEYDKALEYHQKSLNIKISIYGETHFDVVNSYTSIGETFKQKGEYDKAFEYYQKSLKILIPILGENHPRVAIEFINLGEIYNYKREYDKAFEYYQKGLRIYEFVYGEKHPNIAIILNNLGDMYNYKKEYDKALEYYLKEIMINRSFFGEKNAYVANSYNNLGEIYSKKGETFKALEFYQKALIANITDFKDSSIYINPTLVKTFSEPVLFRTLTGKANTFYQLSRNITKSSKDIEASIITYELSFQLINKMRNEYNIDDTKLLLSETTKSYYAQAAHIALEYDKINSLKKSEAQPFNFIEKGKSASLTAKSNELDAKHFAGIPDSIVGTEKDLQAKIGFYTTQIRSLKSQKNGYDTLKVTSLENDEFSCSRKLDSLITFFETNYPAYFEMKYTEKTATPDDLQKTLDNKTAILNYFVGDSSLFIATITDSLYKVEEIPIDSTFKKLVFNYYKNIKTVETDSFVINSQQIYEKLIQPVKGYIAYKEHLVVIPDDYLYYVPFETLIDNTSSVKVANEDYSRLNYLIKSHSISYNHSATLWYNSKKKEGELAAKRKMNFVGFAPVFSKEKNNGLIISSNLNALDTAGNNLAYRSISTDRKRFNPLPFSKDEVTSIVHLFEKQRKEAKAYIYSEANETNFKNNANNYSIIHVSSHGFANDKEPDLSGIVFSQPTDTSEKEDGILYTGETYNLNLKADLVVLSSCESGLGKLIKGEGLQALSRGFLYAGTPNVVFSLWKALDKPTKDLMVQFYSNVLDDKTYAESLRLAKLKLISDPKTAFPHFWGGFVLVGR